METWSEDLADEAVSDAQGARFFMYGAVVAAALAVAGAAIIPLIPFPTWAIFIWLPAALVVGGMPVVLGAVAARVSRGASVKARGQELSIDARAYVDRTRVQTEVCAWASLLVPVVFLMVTAATS